MAQREGCQQAAEIVLVVEPHTCEPLEQLRSGFLSPGAYLRRGVIEEVPCTAPERDLIRGIPARHGYRPHAHLVQMNIVVIGEDPELQNLTEQLEFLVIQ